MGIYKRLDKSPYWLYSFKLPGQKPEQGSTKIPIYLTPRETKESKANEKLAEEFLSRLIQETRDGVRLKIPKKILFSKMIEDYLEVKKSEGCDVKNFRFTLKAALAHFNGRFASEITQKEIEQFRNLRQSSGAMSRSSINKEIALLGAAYNKGIEWGAVLENPCKLLKRFSEKELRRVRYLSVEEKEVLLSNMTHWLLDKIVRFALLTGMRRGEILDLKWTSVDLERGILAVEHSKGGDKRYLTINQWIAALLEQLPRDSAYVFSHNAERVKEDSLKNTFRRYVERVGILDFHFHDLRHTFASDFLAKGNSLRELQHILGHASPVMTARYAHLSKEMLKAAMLAMPSLPECGNFVGMGKSRLELTIKSVDNQTSAVSSVG